MYTLELCMALLLHCKILCRPLLTLAALLECRAARSPTPQIRQGQNSSAGHILRCRSVGGCCEQHVQWAGYRPWARSAAGGAKDEYVDSFFFFQGPNLKRAEGESEEDDGGGDNDMEAIGLATGGGGVRAASGEAKDGGAAATGGSDAGDDGDDNGNGGGDGGEARNGRVTMAGGGDAGDDGGDGGDGGSGGSGGANGDDVTSAVAAPKKKGRARGGKKARLGRNAYKSAMQE